MANYVAGCEATGAMAPTPLSSRLIELRETHGLSQEDAAHRIGIGLRALQRWESGESEPHKRNLRRLADAFGISVAEFFELPVGEPNQLDRIESKLDELLAVMDRPARLGSRLPALRSKADDDAGPGAASSRRGGSRPQAGNR